MNAPATPASWPESWNVTPHSISSGRYTDPAFLKLEFQKITLSILRRSQTT